MKDYNEIYRYAWNAQEIRRAEKLIAENFYNLYINQEA